MRNDKVTKAIGECGKNLIADLFRRNGYAIDVNAKSIPDFIDYAAVRSDETIRLFVRTDTRMNVTGNIVVERFTHRANGAEIGWLFAGKADILCYLDACSGDVYCFDWLALKQYVIMHCKVHPFRNPYDNGAVGDAYIISLRKLLKEHDLLVAKTKVDVSPMLGFTFGKTNPF